ncbi:hypothetical protein BVY04_05020 [bacterium M21]|nr:hypothetical protein BVY04_05020 [bacterium M21]
MKVKLAVLADYANTTNDGKLNIMGIFGRIQSAKFPARHLQCHVVISCLTNEFDLGKKFPYRVRMMDADGNTLMKLEGNVAVAANGPVRDVNLNLRLNEMMFPQPGDYEFLIDIGETQSWAIPFAVAKINT